MMRVISYLQRKDGDSWFMQTDAEKLAEVARVALNTGVVDVVENTESPQPSDYWLEADGRKMLRKMGPGGLCDLLVVVDDVEYLLTLQER